MSIELATTPRARRTDPSTSHEAAKFARTKKAEQERQTILQAIALTGPMTAREVAAKTGIDYYEVQRRISEIPGLRKTDEARDRCMVWEVA